MKINLQPIKQGIIVLVIVCLFTGNLSAQTENVNPKGKWYFGAEVGINQIRSFETTGNEISLQGGLLAEYYFARHWSVSGKVKYFKTGPSFYSPSTHTGGLIDLGSDEAYGTFKGAVITLPVDLKWEFRIYKNLAGSLKLGAALNFETKSEYSDYSENLSPQDYDKAYASLSAGYGLNYFFDKNFAGYFDFQAFNGASKGKSEALFGNTHYTTENRLLSLGVKYSFSE